MINASQAKQLVIDTLQAQAETALAAWLAESQIEAKIKEAAGLGASHLIFDVPRMLWLEANPWFSRLGYVTYFNYVGGETVSITLDWT
jgi:hypothetical protein